MKVQARKEVDRVLTKGAIKAIEQTTFTPALQNDKSISVWLAIPITFPLNLITVSGLHINATAMKTFFLTLIVMLMLPASSLFAQGTSKDATDSTQRIPDPGEFIQFEVEPQFDMAQLYALLKYPEEARKKNIQGRVVIQVYISEKGKVLKTRTIKSEKLSDNPLLEEAAINAIKQTKFTPALQQGKPIGLWISIPISFKLN